MSTAGSPTIDFERLFKLRLAHEERHVTAKYATHRSPAGAYELEAAFWVEGPDGKWQPHTVEQATVDALIEERTSPAVKDALKRVMEAPQTGSSPRNRSRRGLADA